MRSTIRLVALLLVFPLATCGDEGPAAPEQPTLPGPPASVTLSTDTVRLTAIGAAYPVVATVSDADGVALGGATVTWSSGDQTVATVDGSGRVEAVGVGETEITATAGDGAASDAATVIVTQTAVSISVYPSLDELHALGDSARYSATVRDANGALIEGAAVEWSSDAEDIAGVSVDGWATAVANGTATITAAVGELSDGAALVVDQTVASVVVGPAVDTIGQGETTVLAATATDGNGETVADATVVWTTSRPTAAPVDNGGTVTAEGWGVDATITASADGVSGTAQVHLLDQLAFRDVSGSQIARINIDGSGRTPLTGAGFSDYQPAWSPDGTQLAFRRFENSNYDILVMNGDGTRQVRLTSHPDGESDPAWSPDGTQMAFRSDRDGDDNIYVMDADGSTPTPLTSDLSVDLTPAWSPDGTQLAFSSNRTDSNYDIYVMNADGSGLTRLTTDAGLDQSPVWSPDGSRIAFTSTRGGASYDVYVMNADGTGITRLTSHAAVDRHPAWSPDGSRIAFTSDRGTRYQVWIMNPDGSGKTALTDGERHELDPAWRPRP